MKAKLQSEGKLRQETENFTSVIEGAYKGKLVNFMITDDNAQTVLGLVVAPKS